MRIGEAFVRAQIKLKTSGAARAATFVVPTVAAGAAFGAEGGHPVLGALVGALASIVPGGIAGLCVDDKTPAEVQQWLNDRQAVESMESSAFARQRQSDDFR